jgi:hypothetical protein
MANFIKLFWPNARLWGHNLSQKLTQYGDSGVNYAEKSFVKFVHRMVQFHPELHDH